MEMARMETAMRTLGRSVIPRAPEKLVRNMALTARALDQERARRAGLTDKPKSPEKTRETTRELQPKNKGPRTL